MKYEEVMAELVKIGRERAVLKAALIEPGMKARMLAQLAQRELALQLEQDGPGQPATLAGLKEAFQQQAGAPGAAQSAQKTPGKAA